MRPATGTERAALVLLALGEAHGAPIWKEFDAAEVAHLGDAIARLGSVEAQHAGAALALFSGELAGKAGLFGTPGVAEALIAKVLPEERAREALDRIRRPAGPDIWEQLAALKDDVIADYLGREHPQTAALVLSRLPPPRAASVLSELDGDLAIAALTRLAKLDCADPRALALLEQALAEQLIEPNSTPAEADPAIRIATIFDAVDERTAAMLLHRWTDSDAEVADRVRSLMFTFEDFAATPPAALQILLRGLDRDTLALALKGASEAVRTRFLAQMSARAARMMEGQITSSGPVRRKQVSAAQARVVAVARDLEATGELTLRVSSAAVEEDMVE